jgi:hypothetical protein
MAGFMKRFSDGKADQLWAVVNANGTISRHRHATNAIKLGTGTYEIAFDRNVTNCVYVATVGPGGGGFALGEVNVAARDGNTFAVFVDTNSSGGSAADLPFHLLVNC